LSISRKIIPPSTDISAIWGPMTKPLMLQQDTIMEACSLAFQALPRAHYTALSEDDVLCTLSLCSSFFSSQFFPPAYLSTSTVSPLTYPTEAVTETHVLQPGICVQTALWVVMSSIIPYPILHSPVIPNSFFAQEHWPCHSFCSLPMFSHPA
jgi:hypothetical protein